MANNLMICSNAKNSLHLNESENTGQRYILEGTFAELDKLNRNQRIYTKGEYLKHLAYLRNDIKSGEPLLGELDHPDDRFEVKLKEASHRIIDLWYDESDNTVKGKIELLDTPNGKLAKSIVDQGIPLHISSRAAGSVNSDNTVSIQQIYTYDLVCKPGFAGAVLHRVNESADAPKYTDAVKNFLNASLKAESMNAAPQYGFVNEDMNVSEIKAPATLRTEAKNIQINNQIEVNVKDMSKPLLETTNPDSTIGKPLDISGNGAAALGIPTADDLQQKESDDSSDEDKKKKEDVSDNASEANEKPADSSEKSDDKKDDDKEEKEDKNEEEGGDASESDDKDDKDDKKEVERLNDDKDEPEAGDDENKEEKKDDDSDEKDDDSSDDKEGGEDESKSDGVEIIEVEAEFEDEDKDDMIKDVEPSFDDDDDDEKSDEDGDGEAAEQEDGEPEAEPEDSKDEAVERTVDAEDDEKSKKDAEEEEKKAEEAEKLADEASEDIKDRKETIMDKLDKLMDAIEKKSSDKKEAKNESIIMAQYPISMKMNESNFKEFAKLDDVQKSKVTAYLHDNGMYDSESINENWKKGIDYVNETPVWLKYAPEKYKALYEAASSAVKESLKNMADYILFENQYDVNVFWENSGLQEAEERRLVNESFVNTLPKVVAPVETNLPYSQEFINKITEMACEYNRPY